MITHVSFSFPVQLIIAVAGVLTGYNGSFEFKEPGQEYGEYPYVGMRVVSCYHFISVSHLPPSMFTLCHFHVVVLCAMLIILNLCFHNAHEFSLSLSLSLPSSLSPHPPSLPHTS